MAIRVVQQVAIASAAVATVICAGCSDVEEAVNKGGDTPCSEYRGQSTDEQRVTVTKFLKEQSGNEDQEPAGTAVDAAIIAIDLLCAVQANADTPIREADVSGAIAPK